MPERRRLKRRHLIYYLKVFDGDTDRLIGHMQDITTEGIMLMSEDPKETNANSQLRIDLPNEIKGKKQLRFDARSIWSKKDINPDYLTIILPDLNCKTLLRII